jgi:hypothetical protein
MGRGYNVNLLIHHAPNTKRTSEQVAGSKAYKFYIEASGRSVGWYSSYCKSSIRLGEDFLVKLADETKLIRKAGSKYQHHTHPIS